MNRLHHLQKTLPKNIEDNIGYGNIEFVVLNYNSKDDLDEWIQNEMSVFIELGVLNYFKTKQPKRFHMSHSKNITGRCASGDIICNIDADNYTGFGFAEYINTEFQKNENIFISTDKLTSSPDCFGRICVKKVDFYRCMGYDENMTLYGFEDIDIKNRLVLLSLKKINIEKKFLSALNHDDDERLQSETNNPEIHDFYFFPINHASFLLLVLFSNYKYYLGKVIKNKFKNSDSIKNLFVENRSFAYEYSLMNNIWMEGLWFKRRNFKILNNLSVDFGNTSTNTQNFKHSSEQIEIEKTDFFKIEDNDEKLHLKMFFFQITNRNKMERNLKKKLVVVNKKFGKAKLLKNFIEKIELN
jgi:hypothetical protein